MGGDDQGDKTEEPTPHKLREARKKGQVVKSKEVTTAFLYITSYVVLKNLAPALWENIVNLSHYVFNQLPNITVLRGQIMQQILVQALFTFVLSVAPIFLVVFWVAVVVEFLQTGGLFSSEALTPKLDKLNPIEGFKKMFSLKGFVTLFINLVKIGIVAWITFNVIKDRYPIIITTVNNNLWLTMGFVGDTVFTIAMRIGVFYVVVAAFDYFYQRFEFMKNMKMTKQEIKEEYKRLEGDPQIKRRMRQMQREMSQSRMMGNVPKSDVVVTNPTQIAVAIQYDTNSMSAPIVLAKGQRINAKRIRKIAEDNFIPIVENRSLARALFKLVDAGQSIPYDLYKAVAEVLAFVYNLKKKQRGF
ncbi:MAG: flagellar biosynthesis protein FlhB [Candidatus Margulisiibacteriota bacterium]